MGGSCSKNQPVASVSAPDPFAQPYYLDKLAPKKYPGDRQCADSNASNDANKRQTLKLTATSSTGSTTTTTCSTNMASTSKSQPPIGHHGHPSLVPFIYDKLPSKAKKMKCIRVYDGDTITLANNKRVRLLGIDTPELQNPKQAFSEEAKQYTLERCQGQTIWISVEPDGPAEDRYGRLLAWVWVQVHGHGGLIRYECVNEGLIAAGLATFYTPSKHTKLFNRAKLLDMQEEARLDKRGLWKQFQDKVVVTTINGSAFHHPHRPCVHLSNSTQLLQVRTSVALDEGMHACRTCLADDSSFSSNGLPPPHVARSDLVTIGC